MDVCERLQSSPRTPLGGDKLSRADDQLTSQSSVERPIRGGSDPGPDLEVDASEMLVTTTGLALFEIS